MTNHDSVRLQGSKDPITEESTPLTEIASLMRDRRREIMGSIQEETERKLLCYVAGSEAAVNEEDVRYLQELLSPLPKGASIDLLLHSDGGDSSTAEKLVRMLWAVTSPQDSSIPEGELRVVVPDRAKSAATLLALGANRIVMSTTSELGTIDPQVPKYDQEGYADWISVFDYLSAYESVADRLENNPDDPVAQAEFTRFDPVRRRKFEQERDYVRMTAENLLKRQGVNYTLAPGQLMNTTQFRSHRQVIDWEAAKNDIGLNIEFMDSENMLWKLYWKLYCYLRVAIQPRQKIFESDAVSLVV